MNGYWARKAGTLVVSSAFFAALVRITRAQQSTSEQISSAPANNTNTPTSVISDDYDQSSRKAALERFELKERTLLGVLDSNPSRVESEFVSMTKALGYDPILIGFCDDLIATSTTPWTYEIMIHGLRQMVLPRAHLPAAQIPHVLSLLDKSIQHGDLLVKLQAIQVIQLLGPQYIGRWYADDVPPVFRPELTGVSQGLSCYA